MCDMNKMNGQSFTAQKLGLKSSQGSESLFCTGVKHLFGQGIGRGRMAGIQTTLPRFLPGWMGTDTDNADQSFGTLDGLAKLT